MSAESKIITAIRADLQTRKREVRSLLSDLIRFPSVQGEESAIQRYLLRRFKALGLSARLATVPGSITHDPEYTESESQSSYRNRPNLIVRQPGTGRGRSIILNTHVDVVPADMWCAAFKPICRGHAVIGRGACDAKGQIAVIYLALSALRRVGIALKGSVTAQMVIEEEVGGNGSLALIRRGDRTDGVVVLEPTGLNIHPAHRGVVWFRCTVEGRSVHMGRIREGVSALEKMQQVIKCFKGYEKCLMASAHKLELFAMHRQPAQVNIGMLRAGDWPATVPGRAVIEGGVGFLPDKTIAQVKRELRRLIETHCDAWVRTHYTLEFPKLHNDAFQISDRHPLVNELAGACRTTGIIPDISGWIASCDARLFNRVGAMPVVIFGPGRLQDAHSDHECIDVGDVIRAAEILALFLMRWCGVK